MGSVARFDRGFGSALREGMVSVASSLLHPLDTLSSSLLFATDIADIPLELLGVMFSSDTKARNLQRLDGVLSVGGDLISGDATQSGHAAGQLASVVFSAYAGKMGGAFGVTALKRGERVYINPLFNKEARQTALASKKFVDLVASRRDLQVAVPGTDEFRFLEMVGADASAGGPGNISILVRSDRPQRLTLMEEYLHGTQSKLWGDPDTSAATTAFRKWHVRDFMYRHKTMLSWTPDEISVLKIEKDYWQKQLSRLENVKPSNTY